MVEYWLRQSKGWRVLLFCSLWYSNKCCWSFSSTTSKSFHLWSTKQKNSPSESETAKTTRPTPALIEGPSLVNQKHHKLCLNNLPSWINIPPHSISTKIQISSICWRFIAWHDVILQCVDSLPAPCMCISVLGESELSRHPIRSKSDSTKRLHHLGGLLGSRHREALQLGDCLLSFSQQLAHPASPLKQIPDCLMFDGASTDG